MQTDAVVMVIKSMALVVLLLALTGCTVRFVDDVFSEDESVVEVLSEEVLPVILDDYIDQPPVDYSLFAVRKLEQVRGIYVSAPRAGSSEHLPGLIELCKESGINAMVIDVRTEEGMVTFKGGIPIADEMELSTNIIPDIRQLIDTLIDNNIYPIARIVAFKDELNTETRPELYIKDKDGSIWRDPQRMPWLNPYNKDSWDFVLAFAKGAAEVGFKEIQFDYIRFAASERLRDADFGDELGKSRSQIIEEFCRYAMEELAPYGVVVSADVYGTIINSDIDAAIVGQDYAVMAGILDVICPMLYPSHYENNTFGIDIPDKEPYNIIYKTLELSEKRLGAIPDGEHRAVIRPWLQDFTASWLDDYLVYGPAEREAQIRAVYASGLTDWLLWDAAVKYEAEGILAEYDIKD